MYIPLEFALRSRLLSRILRTLPTLWRRWTTRREGWDAWLLGENGAPGAIGGTWFRAKMLPSAGGLRSRYWCQRR